MSPALADRPPPSRTRWRIFTLLLAISIVTYIDRVNISVTARQMMPALGLTGTLSGLMNTGANVGGSLSPVLTPWLAEQAGWSTALVALLGGLLWVKIKPGDGLKARVAKSPSGC